MVALSIPELNQPQHDGTSDSDYLLDCILDMQSTRAIGTDAMRAIVAHQWRSFGYCYGVQETAYYVTFFLTPLVLFCGLLSDMEEHISSLDFQSNWMSVICLATALAWILRQMAVEMKQFEGDGARAYVRNFWNRVDMLLIASFLFGTLVPLCVGWSFAWWRAIWWCKQLTVVTVIAGFMKLLHSAQIIPSLGQLVQLIITVVPKMGPFVFIFLICTVGCGVAFMLVFRRFPDPTAHPHWDDELEFETILTAIFQSFTIQMGDFDSGRLWARGGSTLIVFVVAMLVGNVALLNLLIAIVSDEFDRYMQRSTLESLLALGEICREARVVRKLDEHLRTNKAEQTNKVRETKGIITMISCITMILAR